MGKEEGREKARGKEARREKARGKEVTLSLNC